jgi:hypothetical protein
VVFAVVATVCLGTAGYGLVKLSHAAHTAVDTPRHTGPRWPAPTLPTPDPSVPAIDEAHDDGPEASPYAVADIDDLDKVCEGTYFPQSPKYQDKAPHPVAIMLKDRLDMPYRVPQSIYDVGYSASAERRKAWNARDTPKAVQLVACVDLVASGKKLRTCRFDDPKPDTLPLKAGYYQLSVYETATGRKLLTKRISGDDRACPTAALIGADHTLYTGITERYFVELLKHYVEK